MGCSKPILGALVFRIGSRDEKDKSIRSLTDLIGRFAHPDATPAARERLIELIARAAYGEPFQARRALTAFREVFESVTARLDRLLMPVMAFLTFYSLLVVVFACLYRIADLTLAAPPFIVLGHPAHISFADALYFSVITIATVGYGDIIPLGPLARGLASVEVVLGLLLLLFGFSEIMRTSRSD